MRIQFIFKAYFTGISYTVLFILAKYTNFSYTLFLLQLFFYIIFFTQVLHIFTLLFVEPHIVYAPLFLYSLFFFFFDWVRNERNARMLYKKSTKSHWTHSPNVQRTARYEGGIIGETIFLLHPNVEFEATLRQIFPPALRRTNSAKITAAIDLVVWNNVE